MWEEFKEFFVFVFGVIGSLSICAIILIYLIGSYECRTYDRETGRETKFVGLTCFVRSNESWYTCSEFRNIIIAKEALEK